MSTQASNPYIAGSALRASEGFFGRQDILNWVSSELMSIHTNSLVLYGQRRVGKTTILMQLCRYLPSRNFFPIYFDLQYHASDSLDKVLSDLAEAVADAVSDELKKNNASIVSGELNVHKAEDFDNAGKYFRSTFLPDLYRVLDKDCRPVFLFDEFDVLDRGEITVDRTKASQALFPFLRSIMSSDDRPAFIFVVGRRTEDLRVDFNQMFKTSLSKEVWVLDRQSAETLIRQAEKNKTLTFTQQAIDRILQLTNNHAYFTQLICQRIWQHFNESGFSSIPNVSEDDVTAIIPDALGTSDNVLQWVWDGLSPAEKIYAAALAEISEEGQPIREDQVIKVLAEHAARLRSREVELAPQDLVTRHVLVLTENKEYRFAVELFRRWVKQYGKLRSVVDEMDRVDPLAQRLFQIGDEFYQKKEWSEAVRFLQDALLQNSAHFRANLLLAETYLEMGQVEESIKQFEIAYSLDSGDTKYALARALTSLAREKEKNGYFEEAIAACDRALEISPSERQIHEMRRSLFEKTGEEALKNDNLEAALQAFEMAGNTEKIEKIRGEFLRKNLKKLETDAETFVKQMAWDKAIVVINQLIEKTPDQPGKEKWKESLAACEEEEKLSNLFTLGIGALTRKDWEQAKKAFSGVIYIRPDYSKDNKSAIKLLEQVVSQNDQSVAKPPARTNRIWIVLASLILIVCVVITGGTLLNSLLSSPPPTQAPTETTRPTSTSVPVITHTSTQTPSLAAITATLSPTAPAPTITASKTPTKLPTNTQTKFPTRTPTKIPSNTPTKVPTSSAPIGTPQMVAFFTSNKSGGKAPLDISYNAENSYLLYSNGAQEFCYQKGCEYKWTFGGAVYDFPSTSRMTFRYVFPGTFKVIVEVCWNNICDGSDVLTTID